MFHPLFANFGHHLLQIWLTRGTICNGCKFSHIVAQHAMVQNLVIKWHHLHCFQNWPPGCITCNATSPWIPINKLGKMNQIYVFLFLVFTSYTPALQHLLLLIKLDESSVHAGAVPGSSGLESYLFEWVAATVYVNFPPEETGTFSFSKILNTEIWSL